MSAARYEQLSDHEVVFRRRLDAPPERAWRLWSELEHLQRWYSVIEGGLQTLKRFAVELTTLS